MPLQTRSPLRQTEELASGREALVFQGQRSHSVDTGFSLVEDGEGSSDVARGLVADELDGLEADPQRNQKPFQILLGSVFDSAGMK
jgi:hypothetical protein